jgi:NCK-associated protein 1
MELQVVLKENLVLTLFRDEVNVFLLVLSSFILSAVVDKFLIINIQYILLHEEYQLYVLPRILESKKMAKSGRTKQKEADMEYNVAKQVEKMIRYIEFLFKYNIFFVDYRDK